MKLENYVTPERLVEYREVYDLFDPDRKGRIPCEILLTALRKLSLMPSNCELEELLRSVDTNNSILSEGVSYEQFCQISSKKEKDVLNEQDILNAFSLIDSEGRGYVTTDDLKQLLCNRGDKLSEGEISALIKTAKATGSGQVDYKNFINSMMSRN
nr:calmodulin [Hymenolepis microstoma]